MKRHSGFGKRAQAEYLDRLRRVNAAAGYLLRRTDAAGEDVSGIVASPSLSDE